METGERLSAYLAGELSTGDARALEAELARDPGLRIRLERLRRLEAELGALPDVGPDPAFSAGLRDAVTDELSRQPLPGDELGRRRAARAARTGLPGWMPAFAGAAAVLVLVVGGIVIGGGLGGQDAGDFDVATDGEAGAQEESASTLQAPEGEMEEADTALGPVLVADGVAYDEATLTDLPGAPRFDGIVAERLASGSVDELATAYQRSLTGESATGDDGAESGDGAEASGPVDPPLQVVGSEPVTDADLAEVARCLETVLAGSETLIPVYAELATFESEPVIVFGLASVDPDTGAHTRIEIWAVSRADCEVRFLSQQDR